MSASVAVGTWRRSAAVTLRSGDLAAVYVPELGMLGASLTWRGKELLALRGGLAAYRNRHTTALPLLHPWANRIDGMRYRAAGVDVDLAGLDLHTDGNGLPIHGTMTAVRGWEVALLSAEGSVARLVTRFDFGARSDLLASFPFPHTLVIDVTVDGDALTVRTRLVPSGGCAVPVSFGFHPYFQVPGPRSSWWLRLPDHDRIELDGRGIPTGRRSPTPGTEAPVGARTFDDLIALGPDRRFSLAARGAGLEVVFDDAFSYAQLYLPPGAGFACIEPMVASVDALRRDECPLAEPGHPYEATFTLRPFTPQNP